MHFEADNSIEAPYHGKVNTTFRFVESTDYRYQIGIFFNTFHLLDLNDAGKVVFSKAAKHQGITDDLFVTRLINSRDKHNRTLFKLTMNPFRIPTYHRRSEFVEKLIYKVKFLESNKTFEFSTNYLNDCETIVKGRQIFSNLAF